MSEELKLTLDRHEKKGPGRGSILAVLLVVLIALYAVRLYFVIDARRSGRDRSRLSSSQLEDLALKLENQKLNDAAAGAWIEYLDSARPGDDETAMILYRTGKLYQSAGEYEKALDSYYRSESVAKVGDIEDEMSQRITDCLEKLGRFAALRSELESRTAVDQDKDTPGMEVLAEIGNWKITRSDLESMIEAEIDAQLAQYAGDLPPDQLKARKQQLLDKVLQEGQQDKWLEKFIAEELVYREAMKEQLYDTPEFKKLAQSVERKLLIQKMLDTKTASKAEVTDQEIRDYYQAHKEEFVENGKQKDLKDCAADIYASIHQQKEQKAQADFINSLREKSDVVIHRSKTAPSKKPGDGK